MKLNKRTFLFLTLLPFVHASYAGTMGENSVNFSGLFGGVGGSYNYSTISGKTNISQISSAPSVATYVLDDNLTVHLSPVFNAGYFYEFHPDWYAGLKFVYKYIGQEQYDQSWSGTFSDGTYQTAGLRTKLTQDFVLLVDGGYQFDSWLLYAGAGPAWVQVKELLNGDYLPANSFTFTPINQSHSKTLIGGAGQVGFQYMLPNRFSVDVSYDFVATPTSGFAAINFTTNNRANYTTFNQSVNVVEQGFIVTLNKYW